MLPLPWLDPGRGLVGREPERAEPGYWAGCPGICYEPGRQRFLLSYRQRRPRGTAPDRGWRCALAVSSDGVVFDDIWEIGKDELDTASMERFSLLPAPGGGYRLYICYVDPADSRWRIDVLEAADPAGFAPQSARPALTAAGTGTEGVKDPYALRVGPVTYLFASFAAAGPYTAEDRQRAHRTGDICSTGMTTHPTGLATSPEGAGFCWHGPVLRVGDSWDAYQARLTCVLPIGAGYLGFYDGSASARENSEERCGVAVSGDMWHWRRLTTQRPWIASAHGSGAVRYLDAVVVDRHWWIYYEMARADGAHDLRLQRVRLRNRPERPLAESRPWPRDIDHEDKPRINPANMAMSQRSPRTWSNPPRRKSAQPPICCR